jgi:hypothetical protein
MQAGPNAGKAMPRAHLLDQVVRSNPTAPTPRNPLSVRGSAVFRLSRPQSSGEQTGNKSVTVRAPWLHRYTAALFERTQG